MNLVRNVHTPNGYRLEKIKSVLSHLLRNFEVAIFAADVHFDAHDMEA